MRGREAVFLCRQSVILREKAVMRARNTEVGGMEKGE
jgi:hypothetical protein